MPRDGGDSTATPTSSMYVTRPNGSDPIVEIYECCRRLEMPDNIVRVTFRRIVVDRSFDIQTYVVQLESTVGGSDRS